MVLVVHFAANRNKSGDDDDRFLEPGEKKVAMGEDPQVTTVIGGRGECE